MEAKSEEQDLNNLASSIRNIYIDSNELLAISLDFSEIYFKRKEKEEEEFDVFWESPALISMVSRATQEAVTLALSTITLKEDVDFNLLLPLVIDFDAQKNDINLLSTNLLEKKVLKNFISALRREVFSRVFLQNKQMYQSSEIQKEVVDARYDFFMELNDGDV